MSAVTAYMDPVTGQTCRRSPTLDLAGASTVIPSKKAGLHGVQNVYESNQGDMMGASDLHGTGSHVKHPTVNCFCPE